MYVEPNFKTKKALREALEAGQPVEVVNLYNAPVPQDGKVFLEGPHFPEVHTWYATGLMKGGKLVRIK